jgi:hypothetical protein
MRRIAFAITAVAFSASCASAEAEKDLLGDQLKSGRDGLCYRRDYDAAHIRRHPGQLTQSVVLSFRNDAVRIMLRQKGREHYIIAACDWRDKAGYDSSGQLLIKAFKGPGGYDCIIVISPESAEEGGFVLLDPAGGDGTTLTLHAGDSPMVRGRLDMKARATELKLGTQDREFRLTRTDGEACRAMDRALKGP